MIYKSLNKDFYYEDSGSTRLSYYLTCENETIYAGKATNPKGIKLNIRKLVEDWVQNDMPDFRSFDGELVLHEDACKVFRLYDEESNLLEEYMVFLSYEPLAVPMFTYRGINGHADPRQKIFLSMLTEEEVEVGIDYSEPWIQFEKPFIFTYIGDTETICYEANRDFDITSVEGGWFTVVQSRGEDHNGCLTFTYGTNTGGQGRDGTVCMSAPNSKGELYTVCFPVFQDPAPVSSGKTIEIYYYGYYISNYPWTQQNENTLKRTGNKFYSSLAELNSSDWCYDSTRGEYLNPIFYCRGSYRTPYPVSGMHGTRWRFHMRFAVPEDTYIPGLDISRGLQIVRKYVNIADENSLTSGKLSSMIYASIDYSGCGE